MPYFYEKINAFFYYTIYKYYNFTALNFKVLKEMKVAVVGVTGMVGEVMRKVLKERNFPITEFIPVASERWKML